MVEIKTISGNKGNLFSRCIAIGNNYLIAVRVSFCENCHFYSIFVFGCFAKPKKKTMIYNVCVKKILYLLVKKSFGIDQVIFSG